MSTEPMMSTPPIVGVPRLAWCACGPSSRISCPTFRRRRASITRPPKTSEMSSAVTAAYAVRNVTYWKTFSALTK
jgi:hypothetical protein